MVCTKYEDTVLVAKNGQCIGYNLRNKIKSEREANREAAHFGGKETRKRAARSKKSAMHGEVIGTCWNGLLSHQESTEEASKDLN
jgi:hypothetical protein